MVLCRVSMRFSMRATMLSIGKLHPKVNNEIANKVHYSKIKKKMKQNANNEREERREAGSTADGADTKSFCIDKATAEGF